MNRENLVIIYDNEPRSPQTVKKISGAINQGYNVCIWPNEIKEKDINDMILAGYTAASLEHIIKENTYSGLTAKLKLSKWSKS